MYSHGLCKYMECLHDRTHLMHQTSLKDIEPDKQTSHWYWMKCWCCATRLIALPGLENDGLDVKANKQLRFFSADVLSCESFLLCCLEDRLWNSLPVFETSLWAKSLSCSVWLASATPLSSWEFQNHSTFPSCFTFLRHFIQLLYDFNSCHTSPLQTWNMDVFSSCRTTLINSNNAVVNCTVEELNVDRTFTISSFHNYFCPLQQRRLGTSKQHTALCYVAS